MRVHVPRTVGVCLCVALGAVTVVLAGQQVKELGLIDADLKDRIHESFVGGNLSWPAASVLRAIPDARKPEVIRAVGALAKTYLVSDEFKKRYAQDLADGRSGVSPPVPARTFAEFIKQSQAQADKALAEIRTATASMPADERQALERPITEALAALSKMPAEERSSWEQQDRERFQQESEEYKQALAEGRALPPNPNDLIKLRLREFLQQTGDVDFKAALKAEDGRQRFVKPEYEAKPRIWKACFRAGPAATEAARSFASAWLKELGG